MADNDLRMVDFSLISTYETSESIPLKATRLSFRKSCCQRRQNIHFSLQWIIVFDERLSIYQINLWKHIAQHKSYSASLGSSAYFLESSLKSCDCGPELGPHGGSWSMLRTLWYFWAPHLGNQWIVVPWYWVQQHQNKRFYKSKIILEVQHIERGAPVALARCWSQIYRRSCSGCLPPLHRILELR